MTTNKVSVEAFFKKASTFTALTECLNEIISAYVEYQKVTQEERTKRRDIEGWEKATIARIQAQRDLLLMYLDRSFDERANNFSALFRVVDQAIDIGDNELLTVTLNTITEIAKSSPLQELTNLASVKAALNEPSHEWTL
jgi:hypothetical protein